MGDTGSLALGGALGVVAILLKSEFLLAIVGGVFVAEAVSVMAQVTWFKYTRRRTGTGRRLLRMAPLHHHFEKSGWAESKIIIRFWILGILCALLALSTMKIR
jgi:phospho-N-acetylmuramoyl-pentapeptide-transferase